MMAETPIMYYVFSSISGTFPDGRDAGARLLTMLPSIEPHWWWATPITTALPPLTFAIDPRAPLFDNYPTGHSLDLYSDALIGIIEAAGVLFELFPATVITEATNIPVAKRYAVFHLLEKLPAIDVMASSKDRMVLLPVVIQQQRPMFRPSEARNFVLIHQDLKAAIETAGLTGCRFEALNDFRPGMRFRRLT